LIGQWAGALGGAGLLVSLFLGWYGDIHGFYLVEGGELTGWEAFSVTDLVLAMAGVAGLSVGIVAAMRLSVSYPVAGSAWAAGSGALALALVVFRLLDPPVGGDPRILTGAWLALASSAAVLFGGIWGMKENPPLDEPAAVR
jgi:hypothetical protein